MWPFASKHHAMATNMIVSASALDGLSPYERHMREPLAGMMIPFGALVHHRPPKPFLDGSCDLAWSSRATTSSSR